MIKPTIFNLKTQTLKQFQQEHEVYKVIDTYEEQLEDLFLIRNPRYRYDKNYQTELKQFVAEHANGMLLEHSGNWVYFPWNNYLVHYLVDDELQEIRTARNKNFILDEEQKKFYNFAVGVAGLSVGSHGAITTALMGGARKIKLADPDTISPTNLNRLRFDFTSIGHNKAELIAQYIYQLNPYSDITVYTDGITEQNMTEFMDGLDVLIEELDDIGVKIQMRHEAKKRKIPVIMATDNGDSIIMDIERFDLHPDAPVFYGKLDDLDIEEMKKSPNKMYEAMARIIDVSLVPRRILHSIHEVGHTIYSWPQIASAATLSGAVLAYVVRKIALGESLAEGKVEVNLDAALDPNYALEQEQVATESVQFLKKIKQASTENKT